MDGRGDEKVYGIVKRLFIRWPLAGNSEMGSGGSERRFSWANRALVIR
jgi:hypothetical protein